MHEANFVSFTSPGIVPALLRGHYNRAYSYLELNTPSVVFRHGPVVHHWREGPHRGCCDGMEIREQRAS